ATSSWRRSDDRVLQPLGPRALRLCRRRLRRGRRGHGRAPRGARRVRRLRAGPEMSAPPVTRRLEHLKRLLLGMGALVESQLADAAAALLHHDAPAARRAMALDADVSAFEARIDAACVSLGRYQPHATELRFVVAAMRMAT